MKHINQLNSKLSHPRTKISEKKKIKEEIQWLEENELTGKQQDMQDIKSRIEQNRRALEESKDGKEEQQSGGGKLPDESERDYLIRTGKITAFGNENAFQLVGAIGNEGQSHVFLRKPGFEQDVETLEKAEDESGSIIEISDGDVESLRDDNETTYNENETTFDGNAGSDDDYVYDSQLAEEEEIAAEEDDESEEIDEESVEDEEARNVDDGNETYYKKRLASWVKKRSALRQLDTDRCQEEWFKPHPTIPDSKLNDAFKLPGDIYPSLFDYQKTCVQWLWELYSQKTGGIIGDEMGLGKTIQIISFLAGLHYSGLLRKPVLIVVPATVLNQWVNEFHRWWPPLRCVILHSIGSGMGENAKVSEAKMEEYMENWDPQTSKSSLKGIKTQINAQKIVDRVVAKGHVLITTYVGLRIYSKYILPQEWGYCVLDEGHKIRNPDLDISLTCKQIKTVNRIILSGTPIQNNLTELWSLFDFIFPGRLGTLPVFQQQFSIPINVGGYANSNNLQVKTAYKCAVVLRDLISPYLLRRLKNDVAKDLPKKSEMVLFVKLTRIQQDLYEKFLESEDFSRVNVMC